MLLQRMADNNRLRWCCQGLTLPEMMVCLALMSVLAALALPAYQQQQRQARRSDGQAALLQLQMEQVRWRGTHDSFANTLMALGWSGDHSRLGHYRLTLSDVTADGYTVLAHGVAGQAADSDCTPLRLSWQGTATAIFGAGESHDSDPARCWHR